MCQEHLLVSAFMSRRKTDCGHSTFLTAITVTGARFSARPLDRAVGRQVSWKTSASDNLPTQNRRSKSEHGISDENVGNNDYLANPIGRYEITIPDSCSRDDREIDSRYDRPVV